MKAWWSNASAYSRTRSSMNSIRSCLTWDTRGLVWPSRAGKKRSSSPWIICSARRNRRPCILYSTCRDSSSSAAATSPSSASAAATTPSRTASTARLPMPPLRRQTICKAQKCTAACTCKTWVRTSVSVAASGSSPQFTNSFFFSKTHNFFI